MCTSPIIINTRSRYINLIGGQSRLVAPCGKCPECRAAICSDYQTRAYFEYLRTISRDGFVVFDTLTYNEGSVPSFRFSDSDSPI